MAKSALPIRTPPPPTAHAWSSVAYHQFIKTCFLYGYFPEKGLFMFNSVISSRKKKKLCHLHCCLSHHSSVQQLLAFVSSVLLCELSYLCEFQNLTLSCNHSSVTSLPCSWAVHQICIRVFLVLKLLMIQLL